MKRSAEPSGLDLVVQEASLEELLDLMTDGVCVVDAEARIVSWNEAAAQITGFERRAALGRTPEFLEGIGCLGFSKLVELVEQQDPEVTELKGM